MVFRMNSPLYAIEVEKKEGEKSISLKPDSDIETGIRSFEILEARKECRKLYDSFKKVHGMPAF